MRNSIINKIFSIQEYDSTHNIIRILGIKIKYPKKEYREKRKQNPYYYYKKNNIDITTLPKAEGQIRKIQLANLELLKELDYVCKQNNLEYWLDGGTMLGSIRHKGYIPWDDDIDTQMPRWDYDKIIDTFNSTTRNPDLYAEHFIDKKVPASCCIKIIHKKSPHLFVDIFPYDVYGAKLNIDEQHKMSKKLKKIRKDIEKQCKNMSREEIVDKISEVRKSILKNEITDMKESDFVWGIDFGQPFGNWFHNYNEIYPLKEISFEGYNFPCINDTDLYLRKVYGDYMSYPKKIGMGHTMYIELPKEELEVIENLIKQ